MQYNIYVLKLIAYISVLCCVNVVEMCFMSLTILSRQVLL